MSKEIQKGEGESQEQFFPTVGEQAEQVEYINENDLRTTGAEDAGGRPVRELDSLCMNCGKNGVTRLLMTTIPQFREVIIASFECPHCSFRNSEIQSAAEIQELGQHVEFKVEKKSELGLQVVKSNFATVLFPDLDIEIPGGVGRVTNIEGLLSGTEEDLAREQPIRQHVDPQMFEQIEKVRQKIAKAVNGESFPLRFVIDDPSGNSFLAHDLKDIRYAERHYRRTNAQNRQLGLAVVEDEHRNPSSVAAVAEAAEASIKAQEEAIKASSVPLDMREEVQVFHGFCPSCHAETPTNMKIVNIPHFQDVVIMSTVCSQCGYKSNEVKTGGAVPDHGRRIVLSLIEREDLTRDILKSETCSLKFPDLGLDLTPGTLGGKFTTIEGLLRQVYDQLETKVMESEPGSMSQEETNRWAAFLAKLQSATEGEVLPLQVEMEDPLAASYIQNVYAPDPDPNMRVEDYERTHEENEDLGLNHIVV